MSLLSNEISLRLAEINQLKKILYSRQKDMPEGRLRTSTVNGRYRYYLITETGETTGQYLRKADRNLAKLLAQKDYDFKILALLNKEEKMLLSLDTYYREQGHEFFSGPEELVRSRMVNARRDLIDAIEYDDAAFIEKWKSETYEPKGFKDDENEYVTSSGIRVRSKTELIIAEMLDRKGIPYYYEKPLYLNGFGTVYPDFTVLNVKHRKTMFWEHMGMMDNSDYIFNALEKVNNYMINGHFPGRDLILTHETSMRPIRSQILESTIDTYILN